MSRVPAATPAGLEAIVADDDDFFRLAMSSILRGRHGIALVHEVGSFDEAAQLLATHGRIAFASIDLDMPGMADVGQVRGLRFAQPGARIAIVSGSCDRAVVLRALAAGVHGYIPKTLGAAQLARAVGRVLDGEIYVPATVAELGPESAVPMAERVRPALTVRQEQVLALIARGASNRDIAGELGLGAGTVKIHVAGALKALGVANRGAAAAAFRSGQPAASKR